MLRSYRFLPRSYCNAESIRQVKPKPRLLNEKPRKKLNFSQLKHSTKVPLTPIVSRYPKSSQKIQIDFKTIQLLEKLSLVDLDSEEALQALDASIQFADTIVYTNTDEVQPLYTVLEDRPLKLRNDEVTDIEENVLSNAKIMEEDYLIAPPGNIPLKQEEKV